LDDLPLLCELSRRDPFGAFQEAFEICVRQLAPVRGERAETTLLISRSSLEDNPAKLITVREIILGLRNRVNLLRCDVPGSPGNPRPVFELPY
jgi:hypothetical protein